MTMALSQQMFDPRPMRWTVEILLVWAGGALVLAALAMDQAWFDGHFLPLLYVPRRLYVLGETGARVLVGALGVTLALVIRPMAGRAIQRRSLLEIAAGALRITLALIVALGLGELGLRLKFSRATEEPNPREEPLRRKDPRLGWAFTPSRVGYVAFAGRTIGYAFDGRGYRVPDLTHPVDPGQPSILFLGESIITGYGLHWRESIPARVGAALGRQSANLSVYGYANDQSLMRLQQELPRFARPIAVISLFSPGLVFRDFDDDRPHLGPDQTWRPAVRRTRIEALTRFFVPYHGAREIELTLAQVRAELAAEQALALARGACFLILVPRFGPEERAETALRRRVLDEGALPYLFLPLDPRLKFAHDQHPTPEGARVIAAAITAELQRRSCGR
jgi:hypothetical protein